MDSKQQAETVTHTIHTIRDVHGCFTTCIYTRMRVPACVFACVYMDGLILNTCNNVECV